MLAACVYWRQPSESYFARPFESALKLSEAVATDHRLARKVVDPRCPQRCYSVEYFELSNQRYVSDRQNAGIYRDEGLAEDNEDRVKAGYIDGISS